jgi:hypothetical protein
MLSMDCSTPPHALHQGRALGSMILHETTALEGDHGSIILETTALEEVHDSIIPETVLEVDHDSKIHEMTALAEVTDSIIQETTVSEEVQDDSNLQLELLPRLMHMGPH